MKHQNKDNNKEKNKDKSKATLGLVRSMLHLMLTSVFITVFAMYCSGRVGWFFVYALFGTIVLAFIYVQILSKSLSFTIGAEELDVTKGGTCTVVVIAENKWYLPSLPITLHMLSDENMIPECETMTIFLKPKEVLGVPIRYTVKYSGLCFAGVEEIEIHDWAGFYEKDMGLLESDEGIMDFAVIPDIAAVGIEGEYVRAVQLSAQGNDESEETRDSASNLFGGFPGYDHREYLPGDPVKRINWKMSAGREKLFVRLDELKTGAGVSIYLDPMYLIHEGDMDKSRVAEQYAEPWKEELRPLLQNNLLETALGHVRNFVNNNLSVTFYWYDKKWQKFEVGDESALAELTKKTSRFFLYNEIGKGRVPKMLEDDFAEGGTLLCCTVRMDAGLEAALRNLCKTEDTIISVYEEIAEEGSVL